MYLGTRRRLLCSFTDFPTAPALAGSAADPTAVSVAVYRDGILVDTLAPTRDSTGEYHLEYVPAAVGKYRAVWLGTGSVSAVGVDIWTVTAP